MKHFYNLFLLLVATFVARSTFFAQSGWVSQSSGTTNLLIGVFFTDANTGTAVGNFGTIVRTTNGGATWTSQTSGTTENLFGVFFTDANTGTAVGASGVIGGTIRRTTNGGATWTSQSSGTPNRLTSVFFTDANTGTAVGSSGTIRRTTNAGTTWTSQTSGTIQTLNGLFFTDASTAFVVGSGGTILRTTNGGTTWTSQSSGTTNPLTGVYFTDASTGTVVGSISGQILRNSASPLISFLGMPEHGGLLDEWTPLGTSGYRCLIRCLQNVSAARCGFVMKLSKRSQKGGRFKQNTDAEVLVDSSRARRPSMNFWVIRVEFRKCHLGNRSKGLGGNSQWSIEGEESLSNGECPVRVHSVLASEIRFLSLRTIASSLTSNALASAAVVSVVFRKASSS